MDFKDTQPIYLQIADYVSEQILLGRWNQGDRIPSVRELGVDLQVNPNTVMRTFDFLQNNEIIFNKRGVGYFVAIDAKIRIIGYRRKQFLEQDLPVFFNSMNLLGMTIDDINSQYKNYLKKTK